MTGRSSYRKAAAVVVAAAMIGVGASRLDFTHDDKKDIRPPNRAPKSGQNPRAKEMPLPAFGHPDAAGVNRAGSPAPSNLRRIQELDGGAHVENQSPRLKRSTLLASTSPDAIDSGSDSRPAVDVSKVGDFLTVKESASTSDDRLDFTSTGQLLDVEETANAPTGSSAETADVEVAGIDASQVGDLLSVNGSASAGAPPLDFTATGQLLDVEETASTDIDSGKNAERQDQVSQETASDGPSSKKDDDFASRLNLPSSSDEPQAPSGSIQLAENVDGQTDLNPAISKTDAPPVEEPVVEYLNVKDGAELTDDPPIFASSGQMLDAPEAPVEKSTSVPGTEQASDFTVVTADHLAPANSVQGGAKQSGPHNYQPAIIGDPEPEPSEIAGQGFGGSSTEIATREFTDSLAVSEVPALDVRNAGFLAEPKHQASENDGPLELSEWEELILDLQVMGVQANDTILALGNEHGVYLPFGTLARILDLAVIVDQDGYHASGWTLDEQRTLSIDLHSGIVEKKGVQESLRAGSAVSHTGELYVRSDFLEELLPLSLEIDLRQQAVILTTSEPFPFEERIAREADRARLSAREKLNSETEWPREDTQWKFASFPLADVEFRALSDSARGERVEGDVHLAGDLAYLTAEAFLSGDTKYGLTASLIELGRVDPHAQLLGELKATEFSFGDTRSYSSVIGLRGTTGRGVALTNTPVETASVFENIDLRGVLPDGYEVELYRNDILIGSTAQSQNGQYEFLQVPVDFGVNVFRIVFFGPQGQRREEIRRISVGDGRLREGQLVYRLGAIQKDENLLGVRDPFFIRPDDFGDWRINGEVSYGVSSALTAVAGAAWFETPESERWLVSGGLRTGTGPLAIKTDIAFADRGASALGAGVGARFGATSVALEHYEYSGEFIDETKTVGREFLRRATELDFGSSIQIGNQVTGLHIPLTARVRHFETVEGREQTNASLRASTRSAGVLISNNLEYQRTDFPQLKANSQLFGNFDLTNQAEPRLRTRASLGYRFLPKPDIVSMTLEADVLVNDETSARARFGYAFDSESAIFGMSVVRDFERFRLALDGNYGVDDNEYSVGLRLTTSFGRDPARGEFFATRPGAAQFGAASLRAFQDLDGDGLFGSIDRPLPDVEIFAFNQSARTDEDGFARLDHLSDGRPVVLQVDPTSLPDLSLAPVKEGIEIVPRPGAIHTSDIAIVALSQIAGTAILESSDRSTGVSGVQLKLLNENGDIVSYVRTEIDGYYFFEEVRPGIYQVTIDERQATRLNLCLAGADRISVGFETDIHEHDIRIIHCPDSSQQLAAGQTAAK